VEKAAGGQKPAGGRFGLDQERLKLRVFALTLYRTLQ
jgi:hypothetical protein